MLTLSLAAVLAAAVLSTAFLSGIFGMAGGMILMGILLAIMPLPAAMVLHGFTQMASNGWRAWLWRAHVEWRIVAHYCLGAVAAALGFAAMRLVTDKATALVIIGLLPFVVLLLPERLALDIRRPVQAFACGVICTVLMLLAGVSGPIFDAFFVRSALNRKAMVATKATVQVLGHLLKVAYFGHVLVAAGTDASAVAPMAVVLAVVLAIAGTQLARRVLDAISEAQFRRWSRVLIATIATVYLAQGIYLFVSGPQATGNPIAATAAAEPSEPAQTR
jgi:uncharacterized membrane protein YfcA